MRAHHTREDDLIPKLRAPAAAPAPKTGDFLGAAEASFDRS